MIVSNSRARLTTEAKISGAEEEKPPLHLTLCLKFRDIKTSRQSGIGKTCQGLCQDPVVEKQSVGLVWPSTYESYS